MVEVIKAKKEELAKEIEYYKGLVMKLENKMEVYNEVLAEVETKEETTEESACNCSAEVVNETQNII